MVFGANDDLVRISCGRCGITFAVPMAFDRENREHGKERSFYCPNGHPRVYSVSTVDTMRRERDQARQENARLADELEAAKRAAVRADRRTRRQAAAGACPCCHRSFANMARHMRGQHPDYVKAALEAGDVPRKAA